RVGVAIASGCDEAREWRPAMKTDETHLFRTLEPPPGGVERFRRRLAEADTAAQRRPTQRLVAAGLTAALVAVVVIAVDQVPSGRGLPTEDDLGPPVVENGGSASLPDDVDGGETPDLAIAAEFRASPAFARLLGQPLQTAETRIEVNDRQIAVAEIPSTNSKVRIYQIRDDDPAL